jgi:hypothetical protein
MENGIKMSLAEMMYDVSRDPTRKFRLKEEGQKIKERRHHLQPVEVACSHNLKMKAVGFEKGSGRNGIGSRFSFIADPLIDVKIAAWRFFAAVFGVRKS